MALLFVFAPNRATAEAQGETIPPPAWLEPRGVNIVDMVGVVREEHLKDAILSYESGTGIVQYDHGTLNGDQVDIWVRITPRYHYTDETMSDIYTAFGCLAQSPFFDQWPSSTAASAFRIYAGGNDVTNLVYYRAIVPSGWILPDHPAGGNLRYDRNPGEFLPFPNGNPVQIPANNGCFLALSGKHANLTAHFSVYAPQRIAAQHILSREFTARSFIGFLDPDTESPLEATGIFAPLARQMALSFCDNEGKCDRHDKLPLEAPADTDFLLANFPPTDFDPYAPNLNLLPYPDRLQQDPNFNLPGSGTYRLEARGGGLSVDFVSMIGMPLRGAWQDADQSGQFSGEKEFLQHFTDLVHISVPEYFLPPGFRIPAHLPYGGSTFDPCMFTGGCSRELLQAIYDATYTFDLHYYRFTRLPGANLYRIPVNQVGTEWAPPAQNSLASAPWLESPAPWERIAPSGAPPAPTQSPQGPTQSGEIFLPLVDYLSLPNTSPTPNPTPVPDPGDDASGCPCGWFDSEGRMYDYIPRPN